MIAKMKLCSIRPPNLKEEVIPKMNLDWNALINTMLTGLFVGIGSSLGTWLVTRHFIRHLETLETKLKNGNGLKKNAE
jgi:hypothetical protein